MYLENHIAKRFLCDETLTIEMLEHIYPEQSKMIIENIEKDIPIDEYNEDKLIDYLSLWDTISMDDQKAYVVTQTVMDNFDLLKIERTITAPQGNQYDWAVFRNLSNCKKTFILPTTKDNLQRVLRIRIYGEFIKFCFFSCLPNKKDKKQDAETMWELFFVNKETGAICEHQLNPKMKEIEEITYKLMCFVFLTENDEIVLKPKQKYGTRNTDKTINTLNVPLTIINSRWNTTIVRQEGFPVRGHFAIRYFGSKLSSQQIRIVFIQPYKKQGYIRKAGKL